MDKVTGMRSQITFNGPIEAGVRAVAVLAAAHPVAFDLHRLTAFDYLLVRTKDLDGPESLHPPTPIRSPDAEVRRKVVQQGILLMMSRDLISRRATKHGILYFAGESAAPFLDSLRTPYLKTLKERAQWIVSYFEEKSDADFDRIMRRFFDDWVVEFQVQERSYGASS